MKKNFDHQELTKLANAAFRQAAREVIERAEQTGTPVIIWKHGVLTKVDPREIKSGRAKRNGRARGK